MLQTAEQKEKERRSSKRWSAAEIEQLIAGMRAMTPLPSHLLVSTYLTPHMFATLHSEHIQGLRFCTDESTCRCFQVCADQSRWRDSRSGFAFVRHPLHEA